MPRIVLTSLLLVFAFAPPVGPAAAQPPAAVETAATPQTRLYVKTLPPGAEVTLDGKPLGPSDGLFIVPAGTGTVSVQFDGAAPQVRKVEIADGRITRLEFTRPPAAPATARADERADGVDLFPLPPAGEPHRVVWLRSDRPAIAAKPLSKLDAALRGPGPRGTFIESPLRDVVRTLADAAKVEIILDDKSLEDAGVHLDTPVTTVVAGLSLANTLAAVLSPLDLVAIVRDDLLEVTTKDKVAERRFVHVYDVADLAANDRGLGSLIDVVRHVVHSQAWEDAGGDGVICPDTAAGRKAFVVSQTWPAQWRIAEFLAALRRFAAVPAEERRPLAPEGYWSDAAPAAAARAALDKPVDARFAETALRDAIARLSDQAGVPIALDLGRLENAGIHLDTAITIAFAGRPLVVALDRILDPLGLTFTLTADRLLVTTKEAAGEQVTVALYPLPADGRDAATLIDTIERTVGGPGEWMRGGGDGFMFAVEGDLRCLVVGQTTAIHRRLAAFLRSLE